MDLSDLLAAWSIAPPRHVRRAPRGTNGEVLIFDEAYVLRHYHPIDPQRIHAEHRLLAIVEREARLPFGVPVAIPATDGRTLIGSTALFTYLPGSRADHDDLTALAAAATALGQLHTALEGLGPELAPSDWRCSLDQIHPLVPNVAEMITALRSVLGPTGDLARLERCIAETTHAVPDLQGVLPAQIIHGDFAMSNVLFDDAQVSAVLDFETVGLDLRAADVAAALLMAVFAARAAVILAERPTRAAMRMRNRSWWNWRPAARLPSSSNMAIG